MNPLTQVKLIQKITSREAQLGISEQGSWHAAYSDSAYVYVGGIPFDLTEGDLLAVFAQYGEIVDVNLIRDKGTGKSKGYAFVAYEDQRSTILAVDNLNGAQILGRTIRVDHKSKYTKKEEEDEEEEQRKREERGVCRAFQRGECTRGAGCRFSHNEQRAANTGWGDQDSKWGRDKYEDPKMGEKRSSTIPSNRVPEPKVQEELRLADKDKPPRGKSNGRGFGSYTGRSDGREERKLGRYGDDGEMFEVRSRDHDKGEEKRSRRRIEDDELGSNSREDYGRREEQRSRRHDGNDFQPRSREEHDRREDKRPRRQGDDDEFDPKLKSREDRDKREDDSRENKRQRRHADDHEFDPKSREDNNRTEERKARRHNDYGYQPKSRDHDRGEEQRSRRRNEDELELNSREGRDKGERMRRHEDSEVQPKSRELRRRSENGD